MMWSVIFITFALALFLLPLLPSLLELAFPTDIQPLQVIREYDIDVTHFAAGFKAWLAKNFSPFFSAADKSAIEASEGVLQDSTPFQIVGSKGVPSFNKDEISSSTVHRLILSASSLWLTGRMFFMNEIYSSSSIQTAGNSQFRALLAEGDIKLGENCTVLRWAHSYGSFLAGSGCSLFGRASAENAMVVGADCRFERLNARKIQFGENTPPVMPEKNNRVTLTTLPNTKDHFRRRWLIDGDLDVPADRVFEGDIVTSRKMTIGPNSHIKGSIKSNHDLYLAAGVRIDGAVVSSRAIHMEPGCIVAGPVIAEETIRIEEGSVIGSETMQTTVSAPEMLIDSGVIAHGTVWAEIQAMVIPARGNV